MPLFELRGPEGSLYEVDAPDERAAFAAFQKLTAAPRDATDKAAAGIGVRLGAPEQPGLPQFQNYQPTPEEFAADDAAIAARKAKDKQPQPSFGQRAFKTVDDLVRSIASGATFGLADELAAGFTSLTGLGAQPGGGPLTASDIARGNMVPGSAPTSTYEKNLAAERARDAGIPGYIKIPGEIAGGLATGMGAGRAGLTLMNAANPTIANMALRGAGEGAAYGAAHGFGHGEGGFENRAVEAGKGAALGAVTGGATGAVAGKMAQSAARKTIPATKVLKEQSQAAYDEARAAGLAIQPQSFDAVVGRIIGKAKLSGLDPTLTPNTTRAIERLVEKQGAPQTLEELDTLRQVLGAARMQSKPGSKDEFLARKAIEAFDNFVENLKPGDIAAGDASKAIPALNAARDLWSRFRKGEVVESLIQRAKDRAPNYSASGLENALRIEFRQLLMSPKRLRGFTPEEVAAIRRVARGGPVENVLRLLGKFAPTGALSSILSGGAGYGLGGPIGAVALPAAGFAARQGATALTRGNVNAVSDIIRSGGSLPTGSLTPAQRAVIQSFLIGGAQQAPGALDWTRSRGLPALRGILE